MYQDMFKTMQEQQLKFFSPVLQFNQLLASNVEQLSKLQLQAAQSYTETALAQLKSAAEVKDMKSWIDFNASQISAFNKMSQQMIADGQKLQQLSQEFRDHLESLNKATMQTAKV
jgi:phasin family protein